MAVKYTAPFYDYALQPLATWRAGRTRCHIAFRVPRAGFVGQGRAVLRHQNARCLKSAPRRKTHTWLHQCLGTQAEADAIHCNLLFFFFFFFKWIQEVNSSCSHSQKEAKRAESSGWDPWLAKADLANLH